MSQWLECKLIQRHSDVHTCHNLKSLMHCHRSIEKISDFLWEHPWYYCCLWCLFLFHLMLLHLRLEKKKQVNMSHRHNVKEKRESVFQGWRRRRRHESLAQRRVQSLKLLLDSLTYVPPFTPISLTLSLSAINSISYYAPSIESVAPNFFQVVFEKFFLWEDWSWSGTTWRTGGEDRVGAGDSLVERANFLTTGRGTWREEKRDLWRKNICLANSFSDHHDAPSLFFLLFLTTNKSKSSLSLSLSLGNIHTHANPWGSHVAQAVENDVERLERGWLLDKGERERRMLPSVYKDC